ncbi:MAG: hypothetical protein LBJ64_12410 [Deltaproteobacteria bacterium]|jgi:hypothetical protein|nr:hypothetical protein [Deltaproteobacteria bacterium]
MRDFQLAQANADVLIDLLAVLKEDEASKRVIFSFVTGSARCALTFLDQRPKTSNDMSLALERSGA